MNAPIKTEDSFHQLIHQNHMWGLWEIASQMTPHPLPEAIAYQWKWSLLKEVVKQSATAVPVSKALNAIFVEMGKELRPQATKPVNGSKALYGHGTLAPTWTKERPRFSPLMLYSWDQTAEALHALRETDGSPYEGIALEYTNPQTGGPVMPTMSCRVQLIRKGEKLKARRVTGSSVFHVVQGKGRSVIEGKSFDWEKGDIIALPSWALHAHSNTGTEDAILFSISDRPVIETLGFYREQTE